MLSLPWNVKLEWENPTRSAMQVRAKPTVLPSMATASETAVWKMTNTAHRFHAYYYHCEYLHGMSGLGGLEGGAVHCHLTKKIVAAIV
jgi:hypothetical protein